MAWERDWAFLNDPDVRGIGGPGMESSHECGWLLLMLISNAYLCKFPRAGGIALGAPRHEKDSAAGTAAQTGKQGI